MIKVIIIIISFFYPPNYAIFSFRLFFSYQFDFFHLILISLRSLPKSSWERQRPCVFNFRRFLQIWKRCRQDRYNKSFWVLPCFGKIRKCVWLYCCKQSLSLRNRIRTKYRFGDSIFANSVWEKFNWRSIETWLFIYYWPNVSQRCQQRNRYVLFSFCFIS